MLENGHSSLQTNLWVHITSNIFKISNSKITGSHQPPDLPTLKAYPTPGVGGRFGIFSLKWRERMNLKVPGAILPLGCAILSTRAKTVRGVGTTPLRRTRVNLTIWGPLSGPLDPTPQGSRALRASIFCTCHFAQALFNQWGTQPSLAHGHPRAKLRHCRCLGPRSTPPGTL